MTSRLRPAVAAAVIASGAVIGAGCGEDFDPYERLTALRVFAMKSEVRTQPAAPNGAFQTSPLPNDTVTLAPLMYVPADDMTTEFKWWWCPFPGPATTGYECLVTETDLEARTGIDVPSFELGIDPTQTFTHTLPPEIIAALCAGIPGMTAAANCEGGFPIQIRMFVKSAKDPGITVVSTLRLRIDSTDPALPPMPANFNPMVDTTMTPTPIEALGMPIPDVADPAVTIPRDRETNIVVVGLGEDQAESYTGLDDDDNVVTQRERLTLSWFVESGNIEFERTAFIENIEPITDTVRNGWTPALVRDYAPDTAKIVVIIRDNRGGVDMVQGRVRLEATP
jgi:hypothetical protein